MKRIISVIVENEHGVLARVVNMFAARGYNITSLTVAPIPNSEFSRMTIMSEGDPKIFEQIVKQLYKLIPVYKVIESDDFIEKEMAMVKFSLKDVTDNLADIDALARCYNGHISNVNDKSVVVSVVDRPNRIDNFLKAMQTKFKNLEIVRSGVSVIER
ncbi:acetolactate synthase small subunit [Caminibacter sp.]